jgi:Zn-dependent protease
MTVLVFATGIWFDPAEHPLALLFALALASGPLWVVRAIILSADEESGRRLAVQTTVIWFAIAAYVLFVFELLPSFVYEGFQRLVA